MSVSRHLRAVGLFPFTDRRVLAILLGEAALFASVPLLFWLAAVLAINAVYFPFVEEPGRLRPWEP